MVGRQIPKGHGWAKGDAAAGVIATHHAREVVATSIQAIDRLSMCVEHLRVLVATQTCKCAQTARHKPHRVERAILNRGHAGVGPLLGGIALRTVVGRLPFGKFTVVADVGLRVVTGHGVLQSDRINATRIGQLCQGVATLQITVGQHATHGYWCRFDGP